MGTRTRLLILAAVFVVPLLVFAKAKHQVHSEIAEAEMWQAEMLKEVEIDRRVHAKFQRVERERQVQRVQRLAKLETEVETFLGLSEAEREEFLDERIDEVQRQIESNRAVLASEPGTRIGSPLLIEPLSEDADRRPTVRLRPKLRRHLAEYRRALSERREQRGLENSS